MVRNTVSSLLGIFLVSFFTAKAAYFEPQGKFHSLTVVQTSDKVRNKKLQTCLNKIGREIGANRASHKHLTLISLHIHDDLLDYTQTKLQNYLDTTFSALYNKVSLEGGLVLPFKEITQFRYFLVAQLGGSNELQLLRNYIKAFVKEELYKELKPSEEDRGEGEGKWLVFYNGEGKVRAEVRLDFIPHVTFANVPKIDVIQVKDVSKYKGLKLPSYIMTKKFEILSKEIIHPEVLAKLHNPKKEELLGLQLIEAAKQCKKKRLKNLLDAGANVNKRDTNIDGTTSLHYAVESDCSELVNLLLTHGANANIADKSGWTPLHCAASRGTKEVVELLLNVKANVNQVDNCGQTSLHLAVLNGSKSEDIVALLLKAGANVNLANDYGSTPLSLATSGNYNDIVKLLYEFGAQ